MGVQSPIYSLCVRSDQSCCSLATTTRPGVTTLRALINKQHNQASRVVAVISFDQNMPRAPHVAPVLGPRQRGNFGTPDHLLEQNVRKQGPQFEGLKPEARLRGREPKQHTAPGVI
jgi:hypothetical protein